MAPDESNIFHWSAVLKVSHPNHLFGGFDCTFR